jgi:hypothetical protein
MMPKLFEYVENTWIDSLLWPPKVWSVFMQQVFGMIIQILSLALKNSSKNARKSIPILMRVSS